MLALCSATVKLSSLSALLSLFYGSVASWVNSAIDERMFGE